MDFSQNTQICVKWKAWCALSSEREMLALLPDATPAYSIQVDSCVPLPGMTRWLGKGMPERSLTDPEISWQLFSSGMVDNLIWGLRRAKSPPTSSRLWRGILRRCCQVAEAGGDEGGAGSQQAGTRLARAGFMVVVKTWLVSRWSTCLPTGWVQGSCTWKLFLNWSRWNSGIIWWAHWAGC